MEDWSFLNKDGYISHKNRWVENHFGLQGTVQIVYCNNITIYRIVNIYSSFFFIVLNAWYMKI